MSALEVKGLEAAAGAAVGHKTHGRPGEKERRQTGRSLDETNCLLRPAVHSCQGGVPEREQLGVDDGEHGLAAAVAVTQRELQQVQ